jgi:acetoin utilization deacetylase AcuC-like enzyme
MVLASNGGVLAASSAALANGVAGALSSGLHHARRERGAGFCTFNGLALAALQALESGAKRILILDLDAHCGGGTHSLLGRNRAVRQLDVAVDAFDHYQPAGGNTLDMVESAAQYLPTIRRRLASLGAEHFDLCLYNAGMDPHQFCPVGGLPGIGRAILARREAMVFSWCRARRLPVAFVLAGGYVSDRLDETALVDLHRLTLRAAVQA